LTSPQRPLQFGPSAQDAGIAQLVERNLAKVQVASSSLVSRSKSHSSKPPRSRRVAGARVLLALLPILAASGVGAQTELPRATPQQVGFSAERLAHLDEYMKREVADGHMPGAVTILARHGKVVAFNTYGEADADRHRPMTRDAIFRIYSESKVVTAVAMMILFEEGKWQFDDPITRFIPEFRSLRAFKGVNEDGSLQLEDLSRVPTMRELVTHSAGFGYGLSDDNPVDKAYSQSNFMRSANATEAIQRIAKLPLASQPGLHWRYSAAVDVQGYMIERISGLSLADFIQTRIFGPLKMKDTAFYVPAPKMDRFVGMKQYDPASKSLVEPKGVLVFDFSKQPGIGSGGAGLVSTASDYLRFAQMLANGGELDGARILAPATVRLLASNHLAEDIRAKSQEPFSVTTGEGYGVDVGVVLDPAKAGTLEGEGTYSWGGAAGTWFWVDPKNDLVFVGMMQVLDRWIDPQLKDFDKDVRSLVYGALVQPSK
jgi:CubicO group peptidase (beta-lactamase class C family)